MAVSKIKVEKLRATYIDAAVGYSTGRSDFPWKSGLTQAPGVIVAVTPVWDVVGSDMLFMPIIYSVDGTKFTLYGTESRVVSCGVIYKV